MNYNQQEADIYEFLVEMKYKYHQDLERMRLDEGLKDLGTKFLKGLLKALGWTDKKAGLAATQFPWKAFPKRIGEMASWIKDNIIKGKMFKNVWAKMKRGVDVLGQNVELQNKKWRLAFQKYLTKAIALVLNGNVPDVMPTQKQQDLEQMKQDRKADRTYKKNLGTFQKKARKDYHQWRDQYTKISKLGQTVSTPIILKYWLMRHLRLTEPEVQATTIEFIGGRMKNRKLTFRDLYNKNNEDVFLTYRLQGRELARTINTAASSKFNRPPEDEQQPPPEPLTPTTQPINESAFSIMQGEEKIIDNLPDYTLACSVRRSLSAQYPGVYKVTERT